MNGNVKRKQSQQYLSVNNNGFVSAYALMILQITIIFLLFFTQLCTSFTTIHKKQQTRLIDVAILHSIKKHLQEEQEPLENAGNIEDSDQESVQQLNLKNWSIRYAGVDVKFSREKDCIHVNYVLYDKQEIVVALDDSKKCIIRYEYLRS